MRKVAEATVAILIAYLVLKLERSLDFDSPWLLLARVDMCSLIRNFSNPLFFVKHRKLDGDLKWGLRAFVKALLFLDVRFGG
jgi:hypothetical protein